MNDWMYTISAAVVVFHNNKLLSILSGVWCEHTAKKKERKKWLFNMNNGRCGVCVWGVIHGVYIEEIQIGDRLRCTWIEKKKFLMWKTIYHRKIE